MSTLGYVGGVFDLFHVGHVNVLRAAKSCCDILIVGVTIDELAKTKQRKPVIPFHERIEVVRACRYTTVAIPQNTFDKIELQKRLKFDILFVGDDWYNSKTWQVYEAELNKLGIKTIYLPYTQGTSSTLINNTLLRLRGSKKIHPAA